MDNEIKLARMKIKAEREQAEIAMLRDLMRNPVIQLIGAYVITEYLQRGKDPLLGSVSGTALEVACTGAVAAQQIAPLMPAISQGTSDITKMLPTVLPLLGKV